MREAKEERSVERQMFESAITPIIMVPPKKLMQYASRKLVSLKDCSSCQSEFIVREHGLTAQNLAIYLRMIKILSRNSTKDYCYGNDEEGGVLCYGRETLPFASSVQREVFSMIACAANSVRKCNGDKLLLKKLIAKGRRDNTSWWGSLSRGVLAMNNSYQRTGFSDSKDILTLRDKRGFVMIFLHGHQLKDFLRGRRPEQANRGQRMFDAPDYIHLGHFHRLGVLNIPGCRSLISLGGSWTYGAYANLKEYYPEILSDMGFSKTSKDDKGNFHMDFFRLEIDLEAFRKNSTQISSNPVSIAKRVEITRKQFRGGVKFVLPGNHDPIDEMYVHRSAGKWDDPFNPENLHGIACGDYADFQQVEMKTARRLFLSMLEEEGFAPISELKRSSKT